MRTYFDKRFNQWCTEDDTGQIMAAWGDTKEESIKRFNEIKDDEE